MQEIFRVQTPAKCAIVACSPKKKRRKKKRIMLNFMSHKVFVQIHVQTHATMLIDLLSINQADKNIQELLQKST